MASCGFALSELFSGLMQCQPSSSELPDAIAEKLRQLAVDFAGQFIMITRRDTLEFSAICLVGSSPSAMTFLAAELTGRISAEHDGRVPVEVVTTGIDSLSGVYCIDVDYFLSH